MATSVCQRTSTLNIFSQPWDFTLQFQQQLQAKGVFCLNVSITSSFVHILNRYHIEWVSIFLTFLNRIFVKIFQFYTIGKINQRPQLKPYLGKKSIYVMSAVNHIFCFQLSCFLFMELFASLIQLWNFTVFLA